MSVVIKVSFVGGRYHATPWNKHVNEGAVEWPPSPWRFLRSLIAVWKRTLPDLDPGVVESLITKLAKPPKYKLTPWTEAHTRHYMPWEKKGPHDKTLVFDTFVCVTKGGSLYMGWDEIDLLKDEQVALTQILKNMSFLGRAESWVEAGLCDDVIGYDYVPIDDRNQYGGEITQVLCADPDTAFNSEYFTGLDSKKSKKSMVKISDCLFDSPRWHLCLDTEIKNKNRWSKMPGSKWVQYTSLPQYQIQRTAHNMPRTIKKPTTAVFLIDAPVLPSVKSTIIIAESMRRALMNMFEKCCLGSPEGSQYKRIDKDAYSSPVLSGKDANGVLLQGHKHAHYLPMFDTLDPTRIRRIVVYAPAGFSKLEIEAFRALSFIRDGDKKYRVLLTTLGSTNAALEQNLTASSATWESVTPYVVHRHERTHGTKRDVPDPRDSNTLSFLSVSVRELCSKLELPTIQSVKTQPYGFGNALRASDYQRSRLVDKDTARTRAIGYVRITFTEPVTGPLCLGYNSHFGLGLFMASSDT